MSDLVKRLRIKAGMIELGELIAWGSDSALMREAADALENAVRGAHEDYKLVPVEPTDDFVVLGGERIADHIRCEFGSNGFTVEETQGIFENAYRTIVEEGPNVQGEPVGWQYYQDGKWWYGDDRIKDHRKNTEEAGFRVRDVYAAPQPLPCQECGGDGAGGEHEEDCAMAQTAPDVSALVEALELAQGFLRNKGYSEEDPLLLGAINAVLAAHRKQGGEA